MKEVLEREQDIAGVPREMDRWASVEDGLLRIAREDITAMKTGFFAGLQITMKNGTLHKFRSGKLKEIRAMLGF